MSEANSPCTIDVVGFKQHAVFADAGHQIAYARIRNINRQVFQVQTPGQIDFPHRASHKGFA